ncbi:MAG: DUF1501 domain-containing protein [Phycisphaerales bacterium]
MSIDHTNSNAFTRRAFLGRGLTLASAAMTVPYFIQNTALGLPHPLLGLTSMAGVPEDHVLVVVQLSGGNDGLNTVIPYVDPTYYKARTGIGIPKDKVHRLGSAGVGLHPSMTGMKSLFDDGVLALVQGVGYPNPNRSHFKSMDIWHTAELSATGNGWIGRYVDAECCGYGKGESGRAEGADVGAGAPVIAIGSEAPLATQGQKSKPVAFDNADLFRWTGSDVHGSLAQPYEQINRRGSAPEVDGGSNAGFLMRTALDAQLSSEQIRRAVAQRPLVNYPQSDLSRQLSMVGAMIRAGLKTRVYYVTMGGFDTHAGQGGENGRHSQLLGQVAGALKAFHDDLKAQGNDGRVLTMTFSEFGRRVYQNASQGTDHGTASQMFLMGPMVKAGVLNEHPSLTDLDNGDLKYTTDFRAVYAGVLEGWLKGDPKKILDGSFRSVQVVKKA